MSHETCIIRWGDGNAGRAREVVKRSNARVTGKFPSTKVGRMIQWESLLERDAMYLLEVDPHIVRYQEQPAHIDYKLSGEVRTHIPDIYVETRTARFFLEVKTDKDSRNPEIEQRTVLLTHLLHIQGFGYRVITESEIRAEPALTNARHLHRYAKKDVSLLDEERIAQWFRRNGKVTWGGIQAGALEPYGVHDICRLVINGKIQLDLRTDWTDEMTVEMR